MTHAAINLNQASMIPPLLAFDSIGLEELNRCLIAWGHQMGPLNRPMGMQLAHGLIHNGRLVGVVASAALVSENVQGFSRHDAIELARVCACRPDICRVLVRLWREFVFSEMPHMWAISYQDAVIHSGDLYRFDGWLRIGFSSSGTDKRSGRTGRRKWIWAWCANPKERAARKMLGESA